MDPKNFLKYQIRTLDTILKEDVEYHGKDYFKEIYFIPNNLTTVDLDSVDLSMEFLGKNINFPICFGSLVGGNKKLTQINQRIGEFCQKYKIIQGIGDQIHGIQSTATEEVKKSYQIAREVNPEGIILGNLSARYISEASNYLEDAQLAIDLLQADALEIYLDSLLDMLWQKATPGTVGFLDKLEAIIAHVDKPVIAKTICTGFTNADVRALWDRGVAIINSEGVGGTSFPRMETLKRLTLSQKQQEPPIKHPFDFFGTPTVWSLLDIALRKENREIPLIIGGGIRDGRQAVKALALGADIISLAYPVLIEITEDFGYPQEHNLERWFEQFIHEMRMTMALFGAQNLQELRQTIKNRIVILGRTRQWLEGRRLSFPPEKIRKIHIQKSK